MRVLAAGGGSGGHVTPALAILEVLAANDPHLEICFVCDKKFAPQVRTILAGSSLPITLKIVHAGKFRRYHDVSMWRQLIDVQTHLLNLRDLIFIVMGFWQSWRIIRRFKPQAVFTKGGFVCLPVGIAAHLARLPLIIHESDTHAGLTNRILGKWATVIATGAPLENYQYDRSRAHYVGIPVSAGFTPVTPREQMSIKQQLTSDAQRSLVVVVGGGLGATRINQAMVRLSKQLIKEDIEIIHVAGAANGDAVQAEIAAQLSEDERSYYHVRPFVDATEMALLLQAADVVVSRAGATAVAELAALHKASILIPSAVLTGGHQVKNAKLYESARAALLVNEADLRKNPVVLAKAILWITKNAKLIPSASTPIC